MVISKAIISFGLDSQRGVVPLTVNNYERLLLSPSFIWYLKAPEKN